jgi:hypothetical protein
MNDSKKTLFVSLKEKTRKEAKKGINQIRNPNNKILTYLFIFNVT